MLKQSFKKAHLYVLLIVGGSSVLSAIGCQEDEKAAEEESEVANWGSTPDYLTTFWQNNSRQVVTQNDASGRVMSPTNTTSSNFQQNGGSATPSAANVSKYNRFDNVGMP